MMVKYVLAVSGGVDSVVLLDMLAKKYRGECVVAHVDHGIREDSASDAQFVRALAGNYGLPYYEKRFELGVTASEEVARQARYEFLFEIAKKYNATVVTAHHQDDLVGSIAINCLRGTGWRGLAVLDREGVERPLLHLTKQNIYEYALTHRLEWVEDSTNSSNVYLRNRLRGAVIALAQDSSKDLARLRKVQINLKQNIDQETKMLLNEAAGNRYFYTMVDVSVGSELLRYEIARTTGVMPPIPHAQSALLAVKTARPNTLHDVGSGVRLRLLVKNFVVENSL